MRSLMQHCHTLGNLSSSLAKALEEDPAVEKQSSKSLSQKLRALEDVERYIVFNPRTGQMATAAWIEKHILVQHGVPTFKKASKQNQTPKILTLGIKIKDKSVKLTLDLGFDEKNPRPVRCLHLASRKAQSDLTELEQGYGHMGQPWDEDDQDLDEVDFPDDSSDNRKDENDFEDEIPDDAAGIEGHRLHTHFLPLIP